MLQENLSLKKELRFKDGKFKIALFSDLHGGKTYDPRLKRDLNAMVEALKPDLVLFSGDMIHTRANLKTEADVREYLDDITEILETNNIPWADAFGNHESEGAFENEKLLPIFMSYPNCLMKKNSETLYGHSNYMLPIKASEGDKIVFNIWAFDSGCTVDICDYEHPNYTEKDVRMPRPTALYGGEGYDNPKFDQVAWYYRSSRELEKYCGEKVPSFMFLHIPLPEHRLVKFNPIETGMVGESREGIACSELNHGLFTAALERGDVKGIFVGHDHTNNFLGTYCGVQLGFNAALAYDEYNADDMRGCRVFELDENDAANYKTYCVRAMDLVPDYGKDA